VVSALAFALCVWIALANVYSAGKNPRTEAFAVMGAAFVTVMVLTFLPREWIRGSIAWMRRAAGGVVSRSESSGSQKTIVVVVALVFLGGLALRFAFLALTYQPVSDMAYFYDSAEGLNSGAGYADASAAAFPFRHSYVALLSLMFRLTGPGMFGVIALNSVLDIITAWAVGQIVFLITRSKRWRTLAALIWWLSPFNIAYAALSMNHVVANTAITLILLCAAYLMRNLNSLPRVLMFGGLMGVACFAENIVRPVAAVFAVALVLYFGVEVVARRGWVVARNGAAALAVMVLVFAALTPLWGHAVSSATGEPFVKNASGWSLFVGSSYDHVGSGSDEDHAVLAQVMEADGGDWQRIHSDLAAMAVDRWREMGPVNAVELVLAKSVKFSGNQQGMTDPMWFCYPYFETHPKAEVLLRVANGCYWLVLLALSLLYLFRRRLDGRLDFTVFLSVVVLGLYAGSLLAEVQSRYFMILMPVFTLFAVLGLRDVVKRVGVG
jgi:hypothetical protein